MDKNLRNAIIVIGILVILTPLGLIATGTAFGEWNLQELKERIGYVPAGLGGLSSIWNAPLSDYGVPGIGGSVGYVISAAVGVILCLCTAYVLGKFIVKKEE